MEDQVEWEGVWPTWVALEDQVVDSLDEDHLLDHPTQDHITQLDLEECLDLGVREEGEVVGEVAFLQVDHHNLICHLISALLCTQGKALTLYSHLVEWVVVLEVVVLLIHALGCSSLSMDRGVIPLTVPQCLGAPVALPMAQ